MKEDGHTEEEIKLKEGDKNLINKEAAAHLYRCSNVFVDRPTEFVVEFPRN
jgi:hypothetical protein